MSYVSLDLETTGLDPDTDEIIEVAAIRFDASGVLDTYQTLVNPGRTLEYRLAMLTNIDPSALDSAPHFGMLAAHGETFPGRGRTAGPRPEFGTELLARKSARRARGRGMKPRAQRCARGARTGAGRRRAGIEPHPHTRLQPVLRSRAPRARVD